MQFYIKAHPIGSLPIPVMEIKQIAKRFSTSEIIAIEGISGGYINQSYLVTTGQNERFVLQKINSSVFKNPKGVIDNLIKINHGLTSANYPFEVAKLKPTLSNELFIREKSELWRAMEYIDNSQSLLVCPNAETAALTGIAYGQFIKCLKGINPDQIEIVLPDFRNPIHHFKAFENAVEADLVNRVKDVEILISQASFYQNIIDEYQKTIKELPLRLVHNDTKISNLLFNEDLSEVKAVIDLDTVMPGYLIDDYGDMVRSVCNPAAEDEKDLSKVVFNFDYYKILKQAYVETLNGFITPKEITALNIGAKSIIYTQFIRFLSDYLNGDTYYSIAYKDENLNRAKVQLKLLQQSFAL